MTIARVITGGPYIFRPGFVQGDRVVSVDSIQLRCPTRVGVALKEMVLVTDWTPSTRVFRVVPAGTLPSLRPPFISITASLIPVRTSDGRNGAVSSIQGLIKECVTKRTADAKNPVVMALVSQHCGKLSLEDVIQAFVEAIEIQNQGSDDVLTQTDMRIISRSFGVAWTILDHLELEDLVKWHERGPRLGVRVTNGEKNLRNCLEGFIKKLQKLQAPKPPLQETDDTREPGNQAVNDASKGATFQQGSPIHSQVWFRDLICIICMFKMI